MDVSKTVKNCEGIIKIPGNIKKKIQQNLLGKLCQKQYLTFIQENVSCNQLARMSFYIPPLKRVISRYSGQKVSLLQQNPKRKLKECM